MAEKCALVVDDDSAIRRLLVTALSREGIALDQAADGLMAMERLHTKTYDVVLLDMMMPKMNGVEVLAQMERERFDTPVIVISAASDRYLGTIESPLVMKVLRKPFDLSSLVAEVVKLCGIAPHR
jgi:DNA-binding response OmpR family regulator